MIRLSDPLNLTRFSVWSFCNNLVGGSNSCDFPAKAMWKSDTPLKACFPAAIKGKILMEDMLKRNLNLLNMGQCTTINKEEIITSMFIVVWSLRFGMCLFP